MIEPFNLKKRLNYINYNLTAQPFITAIQSLVNDCSSLVIDNNLNKLKSFVPCPD